MPYYVGRGMFALGLVGLLVLTLSWLTRGDRERLCPAPLIIPFLFLAILALDGGLVRLLMMVTVTAARLGRAWPASRTTAALCVGMPLMLAVISGALALWFLAKARFPLRLTIATVPMAVVAVLQGLLRLLALSSWPIAQVITAYSGDIPWAMIPAVLPGATVLLAVALMFAVRSPKQTEPRGEANDRCDSSA